MRERLTPILALVNVAIALLTTYASGAVITATYVNVQTSDNVNFNTAGNVANFGSNVDWAVANLPIGKFFRFGIAINVTGNPNPAAALWANTPTPQPANLGVAAIAFTVQSTDPNGNNFAAVQGVPIAGIRNASKATFVGGASLWTFATDPGDVTGDSSTGTRNALGSGQVGQLFQIFSGNFSATPATVGLLATPGATWFNGLMFKVVGYGPFTLTPTIFTAGTNIWHLADPGDPGDPADTSDDIPPSYSSDQFSSTGPSPDTAVNPRPFPIWPEPASTALVPFGLFGLLARRRARNAHRKERGK